MNTQTDSHWLFDDAQWYDRSINWQARIDREIPVLLDVFGAPSDGGIVDAGCGTGRQAIALVQKGYNVTGVDISDAMLQLARINAETADTSVEFVASSYDGLHDMIGSGHDGLWCIGNALAAAGTHDSIRSAIEQFSKCLRTGGRLLIQVLNFAPMRSESPCIRGPRVVHIDDVEYVSVRMFFFRELVADITNVTMWRDNNGWQKRARSGQLYPISLSELQTMCSEFGLQIDHQWASYQRDEFVDDQPSDLIIVATKMQ